MIRRVLLVCSGNTCRSPMAMVLLRKLWEEANPGWELEVDSAGTGALTGMPATPHAVTAMQRRGLDLSGHRSRSVHDLGEDGLKGYDLVLTMTRAHRDGLRVLYPDLRDRIFTLGEYAGRHGDVPDPIGGPLAEYEKTAAALEESLRAAIERIRTEGSRQDEGGSRE